MTTELLREIEEDIRREEWQRIWQRYGKWVIGAACAIVAATALYEAWSAYSAHQNVKRTDALIAAQEALDSGKGDRSALDVVVVYNGTPQAAMAQLQGASELAGSGKKEAALVVYRTVADNSSYPEILRALASLQGDALALNLPHEEGQKASAPPAPDVPFYYSRLEMSAWEALRAGDAETAAIRFATLEKAGEAPESLRARATLALSTLPAAPEATKE